MARRFFYSLVVLILLATPLSSVTSAVAQDSIRIAAVVNDEPISILDLVARSRLVLLSLNQPATPENLRQLGATVLRQLIEEKLQTQEAKARGVKATDEEVLAETAALERANGLPRGGMAKMFESNQIPMETLVAQIRSRLLWQRVVVRRMGPPSLLMSDEDIDEVLRQIQANKGRPEYLVAEIVLNTDDQADSVRAARATVAQIAEQLRNGGSFQVIARQVSQSASAAVGGDLGWISSGQMDPVLEARLQNMRPGELSEPIETPGALHILLLRDRRIAGAPRPATPPPPPRPAVAAAQAPSPAAPAPPASAPRTGVVSASLTEGNKNQTVRTLQYLFPLAPNATPEVAQQAMTRISSATREPKTCAEFTALGGKLGVGQPIDIGRVRVGELNPALQPVAAGLAIGRPSEPVRLPVGVIVMMVCQREGGEALAAAAASPPPPPRPQTPAPAAPAAAAPPPEPPPPPSPSQAQEGPDGLPTREAVSNRLFEERFDVYSRRYMRELRQAAFIDLRM